MIRRAGTLFSAFVAGLLLAAVLAGCGGPTLGDAGDFRIKRRDLPVAVPEQEYLNGANHPVYLDGEGGMAPYTDWKLAGGALPPGLALHGDGRIGGGVDAAAAPGLYLFIADATDSDVYSNRDQQAFAIRCGDPAADGPLLAKAKAYESAYAERHAPAGVALNLTNPDAAPADRAWDGYGDAALWTGLYLAAAAYRYAVTKDDADLDRARATLDALDALLRITGRPGFLARGFARDADQVLCCDDLSQPGCTQDKLCGGASFPDYHKGEGEFAGYHWIGDTGVEHYSGAIFGLTDARDAIRDADFRALAEEDLAALADHVWDNGLQITDLDGQRTTNGQVDGNKIGNVDHPNGYNALLALTWFTCAAHATGESRFKDHVAELLSRQYLAAMDDSFPAYQGYDTDWAAVHVAFLNFFNLTRLETNDRRLSAYQERYINLLWQDAGEGLADRRADVEQNVLFAILFGQPLDFWPPAGTMDADHQMDLFPAPPRIDHAVDHSPDPSIEQNPEKAGWALDALDVDLRPPAPFLWDRNPYLLAGGADDGHEFPGVDYLLAYWLGRYYHRFGPDL